MIVTALGQGPWTCLSPDIPVIEQPLFPNCAEIPPLPLPDSSERLGSISGISPPFPYLGVSSGTNHTVLIIVTLYNVSLCGGINASLFFLQNFLVILSHLFFQVNLKFCRVLHPPALLSLQILGPFIVGANIFPPL